MKNKLLNWFSDIYEDSNGVNVYFAPVNLIGDIQIIMEGISMHLRLNYAAVPEK